MTFQGETINTDFAAPPVTREARLANAFLEGFYTEFTTAELAPDQLFLLTVRDFDKWAVAMNLMTPGSDDDDLAVIRGRGVIRQEIRTTINRGAEFGKTTWPPFAIKINAKGVSYEVRLLSRLLEKMPADFVRLIYVYLTNKQLKHWPVIRGLMYSEKVVQYAPDHHHAFRAIEQELNAALGSMVGTIDVLNQRVMSSVAEAQRALAAAPRPPRAQLFYTGTPAAQS